MFTGADSQKWLSHLLRNGCPQEKKQKKSGALAWEQEPRVARFHLLVSFSHQRVGSSILASLSEAGGNEPWNATSKPLPPHSPLSSIRHRKRANGSGYCTRRTKPVLRWQSNKPFIICQLHCLVIERVAPNRSKRFNLELYSSHLGNRLQNAESGFDAEAQPCRVPG